MKRERKIVEGGNTVLEKRQKTEGTEGQWPSFICIPVNESDSLNILRDVCITHFQRTYSLATSEIATFSAIADMHISLSREFSLRFHQIDAFVQRLDHHLPPLLHRFKIEVFAKYRILFNTEKSKAFLCLLVDIPDLVDHEQQSFISQQTRNDPILNLIHHVDSTLGEFQQPLYYEDPIIHISVASFEPSTTFLRQFQDTTPTGGGTPVIHHLIPLSSPVASAIALLDAYSSDQDESNDETPCAAQNDPTPSSPVSSGTDSLPATAAAISIPSAISIICTSLNLTIGFIHRYTWSFASINPSGSFKMPTKLRYTKSTMSTSNSK